MQFKHLAVAGLASLVTAQQSLIQALNGTSQLSNLTSLISSEPNLVAQLGGLSNVTLLAPDNDAITNFLGQLNKSGVAPTQAQLSAILTYHVLNGTYQNFSSNSTFVHTALQPGAFANVTGGQVVEIQNTTIFSGLKANSSIVQQSINFTGGVIHVINSVLVTPTSVSAAATAFNLTSFYGALNATNSIDTVNGLGDVTVFVPNNDAFQSVGSALPGLTMAQIIGILDYHIVNGTVAYSTMLKNESIPTLQGTNLTISIRNASSVFVNNAKVVIPDILVAGGVVHIIDEILNPMNATAVSSNSTGGQPAFSGASSVSSAPYTTGQPTPTTSINTASIASSATGGASSSSSSGVAWIPRPTNAVGVAALGGLALIMQL